MKKLLYGIFLFLLFPQISFAEDCPSWTCGTSPCDMREMLAHPTDECALKQWECRTCIRAMLNYTETLPTSHREEVKKALKQVPGKGDLVFYGELWNAVGTGRAVTGKQPVSEDICDQIYQSAQSASCPVSRLQAEKNDSLNWFNPYCLQDAITYLNNHPGAKRPDLNWIAFSVASAPAFRFDMCCKNTELAEVAACGNGLKNVSLYQSQIVGILEQRDYTFGKVGTGPNGEIFKPTMTDEELAKAQTATLLPDDKVVVVAYGKEKTEKEKAAETRQQVIERLNLNDRGFPVVPPDNPDSTKTELTKKECLELQQTTSSNAPCDNLEALLISGYNSSWVQPACLGDLIDLVTNEGKMKRYQKEYSMSELAMLGAFYLGGPSFRKYQKCESIVPSIKNTDLTGKIKSYLDILKGKVGGYAARCQTLASYASEKCTANPANLLTNLESDAWQTPQCIEELATYITQMTKEDPQWEVLWSDSVFKQMQDATFLKVEYNACVEGGLAKQNQGFQNAADLLHSALVAKGVKEGKYDASGNTPSTESENSGDGSVGGSSENKNDGSSKGSGASDQKPNSSNVVGQKGANGGGHNKGEESHLLSHGMPWGAKNQNWDASSWWIGLGVGMSDEVVNAPIDIVTDDD